MYVPKISGLILPFLLYITGLQAQENPAASFRAGDFEGVWVTAEKNGARICEDWVMVTADRLRGRSYRVQGTDTTMLEWVDLRAEGNSILYIPTTAGQPDGHPVPFTLVSAQDRTYIFTNPQHDFPKRIVYVFEGSDRLHAWIDDGTDQQRVHFHYQRFR